jgi:hypothetical protein
MSQAIVKVERIPQRKRVSQKQRQRLELIRQSQLDGAEIARNRSAKTKANREKYAGTKK